MKTTIDRSKWRCGGQMSVFATGHQMTRMLDTSGKQCCLGFAAAQLGVPIDSMSSANTPIGCTRREPMLGILVERERKDNTPFAEAAMKINDDASMPPYQRERQLKGLASRNGYEFEFVGQYPTTKDSMMGSYCKAILDYAEHTSDLHAIFWEELMDGEWQVREQFEKPTKIRNFIRLIRCFKQEQVEEIRFAIEAVWP